MNVDTGLLKKLSVEDSHDKEVLKALRDEGFKVVPQELQEEAEKELEGKTETFINLKGKTPLAKWAKHQREMKKKKLKRKAAKASRKLNR